MFLTNKTDSEILAGLTLWVGKEREAVSHVLHHLLEVDERKLYLKNASSLKEFCMKVHKYSRHEAQARIDAMRLMKLAPELDQDLDSGRLSLTVASQVQSAFRQEDERRKKTGEKLLTKIEQLNVLADMKNTSTREADRRLVTYFPQQLPREQTRPISKDITHIGFNADAELMKNLERLKAVYHHQTGGQWEKLFEILAAHEIERLDAPPRRAPGKDRTENAAEAASSRCAPAAEHSRYVRKETHQQVWKDWEQGCTHILENGERCGSRENLQMDHIQEFSSGGGSERGNLRIVCGPHNRYRSDRYQQMRAEFMKRIDDTRLMFTQELTRYGAGRPA